MLIVVHLMNYTCGEELTSTFTKIEVKKKKKETRQKIKKNRSWEKL